ncbi:MAG TPA: DUF4421 family protein [Cyclobacteriaceae bacterium]|nr:DUF4421 family protein [Cyclobacteriaceae bacterium]
MHCHLPDVLRIAGAASFGNRLVARTGFALAIFIVALQPVGAQQLKDIAAPIDGTDSLYIGKYPRLNDVRFYYGVRGNSLTYESLRGSSPGIQGNLYRNIGDYIGFGLTWKKWIDFDVSVALPGTTYLKEERSTLQQIFLSARITTRHLSFRGYITDASGAVYASANDQYLSPPSVHESRVGLQGFYFFNARRYSYRAALYQNELQRRSAGSFLLGAEIFYRSLSASGGMTDPAYDVSARYGEEAGLKTLKAPGILLLPGYAYTHVWREGQYFASGLLSAGAGIAFNRYRADKGSDTRNNVEAAANIMISGGYNGGKHYVRLMMAGYGRYELLDPTFLTSTNLMLDITLGRRF